MITIDRADAGESAQRVQVGRTLHVINRGGGDYLAGAVLRSSVHVEDDCAFPGKILQQSNSNPLYRFSNSLGIVVRRHTNQQVYFAHTDQLAKKIIRKNAALVQSKLLPVALQLQLVIVSYPSQSEPEELVGTHGQQIGQVPNARKNIPAKHLHQNITLVAPEVEFHGLGGV